MRLPITCKNCKKHVILNLNPARIATGRGKFCSAKCQRIGRERKKLDFFRVKSSGTNNKNWKGDDASYRAKHYWVEIRLGKAVKCQKCSLDKIPSGKKRYFQWSNISGKYLRDLTDWQQLCLKCHKKFDSKKSNH